MVVQIAMWQFHTLISYAVHKFLTDDVYYIYTIHCNNRLPYLVIMNCTCSYVLFCNKKWGITT